MQWQWQRASSPVQSRVSRCDSVFDVHGSLVAPADRSSCWRRWCWWTGWSRWRLSRASGYRWGCIDRCNATPTDRCSRCSRTLRPRTYLSEAQTVSKDCSKWQRWWWLKHKFVLDHMCRGLVHVADDKRRHSARVLRLMLSRPMGMERRGRE